MQRPARGGRQLAFTALERWLRQDVGADAALELAAAGADPRERALAHELVLGVIRWQSRLDGLLGRLLREPLGRLHPSVLVLLRLGLYQLRASRSPDRAVLHETVELCRTVGVPWATRLVNGVLRAYQRERERLEALPEGDSLPALAERWAHPLWLVERISRCLARNGLSADTAELTCALEASLAIPPLTLRLTGRAGETDGFLARLAEQGREVSPGRWLPDAVQLSHAGAVTALPGFADGAFVVQDEASQLVTLCCGDVSGRTVLDACAAPGGKTSHLAERIGTRGRLIATDSSSTRLLDVRDTLARVRPPAPVRIEVCDWAADPPGVALPVRDVDLALVDAPCSGLGVVRRIPEIKWRRLPPALAAYADRQLLILLRVAEVVRPGGALVYSVCSPLEEEGPGVVERFLEQHRQWEISDLRLTLDASLAPLVEQDGTVRTWPHRHGCDGFFVARLTRRS